MTILTQTSLYYSEGRSDKEYHVELVEIDGGHRVNVRYGRRGSTLTAGTKTAIPVDYQQAKSIFDKLVKEKSAKGYTEQIAGTPYQSAALAGRQTSFAPQLLNSITESEAMRLLSDSHWAAQEKMDGERRAAHAERGHVVGANRKGLSVLLPTPVAEHLQTLEAEHGTLRIDGELIGEILYVFDLHVHRGQRLHAMPWIERMHLAERTFSGNTSIKPVPVAVTTDEKQTLWQRVKDAQGEGIVFKKMDAPVTRGRPNSGGDWLKYKFTESATCGVIEVNSGKRSVRIGLLDRRRGVRAEQRLIPIGNVTIPPSQAIPAAGDIIEVAYLYAYPGGSLFQPAYRGPRPDLDIHACGFAALKYKLEGREEEAA